VSGDDPVPDLRPRRRLWPRAAGAGVLLGLALLAGCRREAPVRAAAPSSQAAPASQEVARARPPTGPPTRFSAEARRRRAQVFAAAQREAGFTRLGEPEFGDWLTLFREPGQTLDEYLAGPLNRRTPARQRLYLQPFADLSLLQRELLPLLRDHLAGFFASETVVLPERPVPRILVEQGRRQVDAGLLVRDVARALRPDGLVVAGVLGTDIYEREGARKASTFGLSLIHDRAALTSLYRTGTDREKALRRALKLVTHETGHAFGLEHCIFYRCLMNGVRSLGEVDPQPLHLCPVCLAKGRAARGFEPRARYERLAAFYRSHGLAAEAAFALQRAAEVRSRPR
jgi:archaemetzincin